MRILHVFSAEFFAGSVAYAVQLAEAHRAQGHAVWLVSDSDQLPSGTTQLKLPISRRSLGQRLRNLAFLRGLVRREGIDVVHAHSRAASWVSYYALRGLRVPLVSTVHGRQHLHTARAWVDVYGDKIVAICENLRQHLTTEISLPAAKILAIPNGVSFGPPAAHVAEAAPRLAFIGRFNGGKGERAAALLRHVFPSLMTEVPGLRLALIGGELEQLPAAGKTALTQLRAEFGERVEVVGFTTDVPGWLARTTLVIGAGRVAIEALGAGCPVLALGEATCEGVVTEDNFAQAAASNFGDIAARLTPDAVQWPAVLAALRGFLARPQPVAPALVARVRAHYDLAGVAARVLTVYQSARMRRALPRHLPVLMYHKIPDAPLVTKHQIYVTKADFEKHLAFFRAQKMTPITFADYLRYASGELPLSQFPARPIVLTFDDGYADNYTNLLPLMQQYGYRGVIYLLGDFDLRYNKWDLDRDPTEPRGELMSLAQKQAFVAAGWEIGAHTMTHPHLPALPPAEAAAEIRRSRQQLEGVLGTSVVSFAYPYGDCDAATREAVRAAGFALGVATDSGGRHLEDDRMQVFRVNVFPHETLGSLRKKISPLYRAYYYWKRKK